MIKMILVDDEPIICQGLRTTIPWIDYSVEIVDEAYDGKEALEKIKMHGNIDIVLTDVIMPEMDGLQFVEALTHLDQTPKVIMISGYDEFDYAIQAMRLGVKDYLLKPVEIDELLATVQKLKEDIQKESKEKNLKKELQLKHVVQGLLNNSVSKENVSDKYDQVTIFPILSSLKNYYDNKQFMTKEILLEHETDWSNLIEDVLKMENFNAFKLHLNKNIILTCIYNVKEEINEEHLDRLFRDTDFINDYHIVYTDQSIPVRKIATEYAQLRHQLEVAYINDSKHPNENDKGISTVEGEQMKNYEGKIVEVLFNNKKDKLLQYTDELFSFFQHSEILLSDCLIFYKEIEMNVLANIEKWNYLNKQVQVELIEQPVKQLVPIYNSYKLMQQFVERNLLHLYTVLSEGKSNESNWMIERAVHYLEKYYNKDLKASEVADYINLSPNYFSTLFKKQVGVNFNEYLNQYRVEKAKNYLKETSDKVSNIAEQVGYSEYKYFVQVFKRIVNLTPTEYRNLVNDHTE